MTPPKLLTVQQVAVQLDVSRMTVYRLIAREELVAFRVAGTVRIDPRDLVTYMRGARTVPMKTGGAA